ncbi:MAG: YbhB/YbcL family Raf kinase inhibitor-like protein [Rhodocyclaceae bacterium]|nr:YbhB/YbcL family Raf kinase inhibitor-like protein [Rhodocyclaceae bacterium]
MDIKQCGVTLLAASALCTANASHAFELHSNLEAGQAVPADYYQSNFGCTGQSTSPQLIWKDPPAGTKSFAITFFDKSAPTQSGFWHYLAYDIPASATGFEIGDLTQAKLPPGTREGNTDLGKPGYFGPCPPVGRKHHYVYTVFALKTDKLDVPSDATAALVSFYIWSNTLDQVSLEVTAGPRK